MPARRQTDNSAMIFDPSLKLGRWGGLKQRFRNWKNRKRQSRRPGRPRRKFRLRLPTMPTGKLRIALLAVLAVPPVGAGAVLVKLRSETSARLVPGQISLGRNAPLGGMRLFPEDNHWNTPVDDRPLHPDSDRYIQLLGYDTPLHPDFGTNRLRTRLFGIPYVVVASGSGQWEMPEFDYGDETDNGPYPIPADVPIELGGDRHALIIDRDQWKLHELYLLRGSKGNWEAGSGAIYDLTSNVSRPRGWTSADAAGLAILPGLARADEVYDLGEINHALRFTARRTHPSYVYPARHRASRQNVPYLPPMGLRLRLRADVDLDGLPPGALVIARALQRYGMILADNGGPLYVTGTADRRWKRRDTEALKRFTAEDFEVVVPPPPPVSDTAAIREMLSGASGFSEQ